MVLIKCFVPHPGLLSAKFWIEKDEYPYLTNKISVL